MKLFILTQKFFLTLFLMAWVFGCNPNDEPIFIKQTKQITFLYKGANLNLNKGISVNQLDVFEVTIQANDIRDNSLPTDVKVSSIPFDGSMPLPEIQLGAVASGGSLISPLPPLGIETKNHKATLKFVSTFKDGEEEIRTFQVKPVSPFTITAPASTFALINNLSYISYSINSGNAVVDLVTVRTKVNNGTATDVVGPWGTTGKIPVQGMDYQVGDVVYFQIEASNANATVASDWVSIPVLRPVGTYTYIFETFFGGTAGKGFTDGCWSGVQGGKSFVNTIYNFAGASGGTGTFNLANGWNTSLTPVVGNTSVLPYSGLLAANFSSTPAAGATQDLLTPLFDISNTTNNKLELYYYCQASGALVNHMKIFTTTDDVNWTEIIDLAEQPSWAKQLFDIAPNVIRVKFTGISSGVNNVANNTYIDDVKIYGDF